MAGLVELVLVVGGLALCARQVHLGWRMAHDDPHPPGDWEFFGSASRPVHALVQEVVALGDDVLVELAHLRGDPGSLPARWVRAAAAERRDLAQWRRTAAIVSLHEGPSGWRLRCGAHDVEIELLASPAELGPLAD